MAQASFSELLSLRMDIENTAKVLQDLEEVKKAIYKFNDAVKDSGTYARKAFSEIQKGTNQAEKLAQLNYSMRQKLQAQEIKDKLKAEKEKADAEKESIKKSLSLAQLNYSMRQKFLAEEVKNARLAENEKRRSLNASLKAAENAVNKELALYRQLEIAKAKAMATYGKIPASVSVSQAMNIPLDAKFKSTSATDLRNSNITAYRQALQDIKLMNVEERKLLAEEKQRTQELARQSKEMQNQEKSAYSIGKTLHSMKSNLQGFMTSSFVFKRFFDSIIGVVDEWSKMSVAMSQFRSSGNFDDVNKQLDQTVKKLDNVISRYEMIPAINKAKMLGFDFSNGKLSETLEMTTKIAQMFGMDATKAFGDFTVAISKASPIIMDNVGVLLRLEEAYQMYYESQYKGTLSFEKFEKSLTQAEKRAIYYGQAMRLLQEKTEGVSVKTNEAQSVLMRLKDAWYSLGTDLESGGGLNPIIWALEKVVSLAETAASTFMRISDGFKALQYSFPSIFGKADLGLNAKEVEDVFRNKKTAEQGVIEEYGGTSLKNAENFYNKLFDITVKYREELDNIPVIKDESERDMTRRVNIIRARYETVRKDLETIQDKYEKSKEVGYSLFDDKDYALLKRYVKGIDEVKDKSERVANMSDEISQQFSRAGDKYINSDFFGSLIEVSHGAVKWFKDFSGQNEIDLRRLADKTGINPADMRDELVVKKELLDIDIRLANNKTLDEALHRNYNTEKEKLTANLKAEYQERIKLNAEQTKAVEILKGEGEILAIIGLNSIRMGDRSKDQNYITSSTQLKEKWNPDYTAELEKSMKKAKDLYKIEDKDVLRYNLTDEMKRLYMDMPEGLKGTVNELEYIARPFKEKLINAITLGVEDKEELELRLSSFEEIYSNWLKTSTRGAPLALLNNLPALITGFKKKETSSRTKKPKDLETGWYEMNRDLYKETLPETMFKKSEEARLELFQSMLELQKLEKNIQKTKAEHGAIDRDINVKLGERQSYVDMLNIKYQKTVELAQEEYKILMMQQTAREKMRYESTIDLTTKGLSANKFDFSGKYFGFFGSQQKGIKNATEQQKILNQLKVNQLITDNKLAIQSAIKEEKSRINVNLAKELSDLGSEAEYKDVTIFKQKQNEINIKYKQEEKAITEAITNEYEENLIPKIKEQLEDQELLNALLSAQSNEFLKRNNLFEKYGRMQNDIKKSFEKPIRQSVEQSVPGFSELGFGMLGFGEAEIAYAEEKARKAMSSVRAAMIDESKNKFSKLGITDEMYSMLGIEGDVDAVGLETIFGKLKMTDAQRENIKSLFDELSGGIKSSGQKMVDGMREVADAWKNIWQDAYRDIANFGGQMVWDWIIDKKDEALWEYEDKREESLATEKKNLEKGQITKEQYLQREAIIEKNYYVQKSNLEKQSTKEMLKSLGSMFFFKGLGYVIEAPIKYIENPALGGAYAGAGAALMLLGGSLGGASRGYRPSKTSSFEDEAKVKDKDTNIYIDNRIFEDKRQMQKLYQSSLNMEV